MKIQYVDMKTLCAQLSLSRATVDRLVARGELQKMMIGRKALFSERDISALIKRKLKVPASKGSAR